MDQISDALKSWDASQAGLSRVDPFGGQPSTTGAPLCYEDHLTADDGLFCVFSDGFGDIDEWDEAPTGRRLLSMPLDCRQPQHRRAIR